MFYSLWVGLAALPEALVVVAVPMVASLILVLKEHAIVVLLQEEPRKVEVLPRAVPVVILYDLAAVMRHGFA